MRRFFAIVVSLAIVTSGLLVPAVSASAAPPDPAAAITVSKSAPQSVLEGETIPYKLTISNPSGPGTASVPEYNVGLRDVLPAGVSYVTGTTSPSGAGEPTVVADQPSTGLTTLLWPDVFDLQPGDSQTISFSAQPSADFLVGSSISNTASAYANTNPRVEPVFTSTGQPDPSTYTQSSNSNAVTTAIGAIALSKSEPSVEAKLLRGIHQHPTTYTLTAENNTAYSTSNVVITDYLPADQEFLGCGNVDNTTEASTNPGSREEYPGSGLLTVVPAVPAMDQGAAEPKGCLTPDSVETVSNPPGFVAGVYTTVTWTIGTMGAGAKVSIQYAAGVPLRENAMFTSAVPTTGTQTANLDNNTGALTRQDGNASGSTNYATVAGLYSGNVALGTSKNVTDTTSHTVHVQDLRIHKSVSSNQFIDGGTVTYSLAIQSGEYTDNSAISVTDVLPNGTCPLGGVNYVSGAPADCAPMGDMPSVPYKSVTQNSDGTFTVVFEVVPSLAANGSVVVTYPVRTRVVYTGGALAGSFTSAGDSFTNNASESGTSNPIAANTVDAASMPVTDSSSATMVTATETLKKMIGTRAVPMDCISAAYVDGSVAPGVERTFVKGDRVCFNIRAAFAASVETDNINISDFLPLNVSYDNASWKAFGDNNAATTDPSQVRFSANNGLLNWSVGTKHDDGSTTAQAGTIFNIVFSATVSQTAPGTTALSSTNLAKMRATNSQGSARSYRDNASFLVDPAPLQFVKGVASVNGTENLGGGDNVPVRAGDTVVFHLDAQNKSGTPGWAVARSVDNVQLWDVLPAGIACKDISGISDGGICTNPGDAAQPTFSGNDKQSAIVFKGGVDIASATTHSYNYTVVLPTGTSASAVLTNTAAVRSYEASTDVNGSNAVHYPATNIDTSLPAATVLDSLPVTDPSDIYLPALTISKGVTSAIKETGNTGLETAPAGSTQATPGEQVSFTVTGTVPAGTSVYQGVLSDPLPVGLVRDSVSAQFVPDAANPVFGNLPSGVSVDSGTPAELKFGSDDGKTPYDNTSATDQVFHLVITAHTDKSNTTIVAAGKTLTNTAKFASVVPGARSNPVSVTAQASSVVVEPKPTLAKTNNEPAASKRVVGGQAVTYTLKAGNAVGASVLHDAWVVDCMPASLTFTSFGTASQGTPNSAAAAGPGGNNTSCAVGTTQISWNVGDLPGGTTATLSYVATVDHAAAGGVTFTNRAALSGGNLAQARTQPTDPNNPDGRSYQVKSSSDVRVAGESSAKTVTPSTATIGDTVTYTVSATLPARVNFYNTSLVDSLPAGIDPATVALVAGSVHCTNADNSTCSLDSATLLGPSGTSLAWFLGDAIAENQQRVVSVQYTAKVADVAAAAAGASLSNSVHSAWDVTKKSAPTTPGYAFDQSGVNSTASLGVLEPKVTVAKSVSTTKPEPGSTFTYSLNASNAVGGNISAAYNLTVVDKVPTNVVVDAASITGGGTITGNNPVTGGGTITWTIAGPLAPGASVNAPDRLSYSAMLAPSTKVDTTALVNTASVDHFESRVTGGRNYQGNQSTATVNPNFPKLSASKVVANGTTSYVDSPFGWKVTVSNAAGAGTAYKAGATDVLPANWVYDTNSATVVVNGGVATAIEPTMATTNGIQTLTWAELGTLPAGANLTINYTAHPAPAATSTPGAGLSFNHTNTATPSGQDATGATGNSKGSYSGSAATAVAHLGSADVKVTKTVGSAPTAGSNGTWVLSVSNDGPDTADGPFTLTDDTTPPIGITVTAATGSGWTCTLATVSCVRTNPNDTLAKGASFPAITITYSVASNVANGTQYPNTASVTTKTFDPKTENNSASATATVSTTADLGLIKKLVSPMVAGTNASYTLTTTNYGPSNPETKLTITDTLPAGTTFVSATGDGWTCPAPLDAVLTCTSEAILTPGQAAPVLSVVVSISAQQTADVTNTAKVSSPTAEPATDPHSNTSTVTTAVATAADMGIVKTLTTSALVAGTNASYNFAVTNHGPSDARKVTVTDTLDPELSFVSGTGTNWSCAAVGQLVTCLYQGDFPSTTPVTTSNITFVVKVSSDMKDPVSNTVAVSSSTEDPGPVPNTSTTPGTAVSASADLSIAKSHTGDAVAGSPLNYTLAVHNNGPSDEIGAVTVTDSLPAGMSYVSATGTGWNCSADGALVTCVGANNLAVGTDADPITLAVAVAADAGPAILTNAAAVTGTPESPDPSPGNNRATDPTTVGTTSAIALAKTLTTAAPVVAGTNATFALQASNSGPSVARDVTITDTLPEHMRFVSANGDGWTCAADGSVVTCQRADLALGNAPVVTLVTMIDAGTAVDAGTGVVHLSNTATITTSTPGTTANPNPVDVPVVGSADLVLHKSASTETVVAGTQLGWVLKLNNAGPSDTAGPLTVTDTLPEYQTFVSASGDGWTCTAGDVPAAPTTGQLVTCTYAGLANGQSATDLMLKVQVAPDAPKGTETNSATVTGPAPDPIGANNTATAPVNVDRVQDLAIVKTHIGDGTVGQSMVFTLGVSNQSPTTATQVHVADTLPAGLDFVEAVGAGWTCSAIDRVVNCDLEGTLAPGIHAPSIAVTVSVSAVAYPKVDNTAVVSSLDPELPGTHSATDTLKVVPTAALSVTKTHVARFQVGQQGHYTLQVTNAGPTPTPGPVTVEDILPDSLSFVSATGDGWTCTADGQHVRCELPGELTLTSAPAIDLVVNVLPAAFPSVENSVTANALGSGEAVATDVAPVDPRVVWGIDKTLKSYSNDTAVYTIAVTNKGDNPTVSDTVVTDSLPDGLRFESATGDGWSCKNASQTIDCSHAAGLTAGSTSIVTVTAHVVAAAGTVVANTATVSGGAATGTDTPTAKSPAATFTVTAAGELSNTGAQVAQWLLLAGLLMAAGTALVQSTRKRGTIRRRA